MKRILFFLCLLTLFMTANMSAQTTLYSESFETDGFGTEYTMNRFSDGGQDYFGVVDNDGNLQYLSPQNTVSSFSLIMTNLDGVKCVGGEDLKQTDNPINTTLDEHRGFFVTKTLNVLGHSTIEIKVLLGCRSTGTYEGVSADNDALRIQYAFDGNIANGANSVGALPLSTAVNTGFYTDFGRFLASAPIGGTMMQDTDLDGVPDGANLGNAMVEYTFSIPVTGINLSVRIHMDYDDSAEEIAFDFLRITGNDIPLGINDYTLEKNIQVSPNPLKEDRVLHITNNSQYAITSVEVYDIIGKKMFTEAISAKTIQFPNSIPSGIYFVKFTDTKNNSVTKKIML